MNKIKNVIFDLGDVLLNLDYTKTTNAFKELGFTDFEKMYTQFKANNVFDNLETGHISEEDFFKYMFEAATTPVTKEEIINAWGAMLLDFRLSSLQYLEQLSKHKKLFLLSNTNKIHQPYFEAKLKAQTGISSLDPFFTKVYFSHEVGMRKPNEDIFQFVLQDAGIIAAETMFIDDIQANVAAAAGLGIKTHQLLKGEKIEDLQYD